MKKEITALLIAVLLVTAYLTLITPANSQTQQTPEILIQPSSFTATKLDETFNVSVNIKDVATQQQITGVQFRVLYNSTLLEPLKVSEGSFLKNFPNRPQPPYTYFINYVEDDPIYGPNVLVGILLLPNDTGQWTNFPHGNGTLATITFKTIYRPLKPSPPSTCLLNLTDTMIINKDVNEVSHEVESAVYTVQPIPIPKIKIEPSTFNASLLGELFNISVSINNLDSDLRVVGAQFRVQYNASLLQCTNVYEGSFFQQFNNTAKPPYTYFINYVEDDPIYGPNVLVGILLLPNDTGQWTNFPHGNGTLATITFKTIYQPNGQQLPVATNLILNDTMLINDTIEEVPYTTVNGLYQVKPLTFQYEPSLPSAGEVVIFKVAEPENHASLIYNWNFGDGTAANTTESTIRHIFSRVGEYNVTLTCIIEGAETFTSKTVKIGFYLPLDITVDVGSVHFTSEIAEFNILVAHYGRRVDPDTLSAILYYNGASYADLSGAIQRIDTGMYVVNYMIPTTAEAGEYTLLVEAQYYTVEGVNIKSFLISSTLTKWDAQLLSVNNSIGIIKTDVGLIKANLTVINATLLNIKDRVVTMNSTIGTIKTTVDTLNLTIASINENVVTMNSTIGTINATVFDINTKLSTINDTMLVTMKTSVGNIEGYVKDVDNGGLATISTALGDVTADISTLLDRVPEKPPTVDLTPVWIAAVFAILTFLAVLFLILRKK